MIEIDRASYYGRKSPTDYFVLADLAQHMSFVSEVWAIGFIRLFEKTVLLRDHIVGLTNPYGSQWTNLRLCESKPSSIRGLLFAYYVLVCHY